MEHLLIQEYVDALKMRAQHIEAINKSKEQVTLIDEWLKPLLIDKLNYGVNRCNYNGIDIKISRNKDTPAISSKTTSEQVAEVHARIGSTTPFIKYQPVVVIAAHNSLSDADKNIISDVVYLRPTAAKIEVSYV